MKRASILIPAHNEEAVIARTLWFLSRGLNEKMFDVIVIANGCTDATAARAQSAMPQATILSTPERGKYNALNLGYEAADKALPVICLDADLDVTSESLQALLPPIEEGAAASCGKMDVDTSSSSRSVRRFYRGWRRNPYFNQGKFGGLFALSAKTAAEVFPLPPIIADDEYIRRSLRGQPIAFVSDCRFVAKAPSDLATLIRVRRRSRRGSQQLTRLGFTTPEYNSKSTMFKRALVSRQEFVRIAFFACVMAWVRLTLLFEGKSAASDWERDMTSRKEAMEWL